MDSAQEENHDEITDDASNYSWLSRIFGRWVANDNFQKEKENITRQSQIDAFTRDLRINDVIVAKEDFQSDSQRDQTIHKKGSKFKVMHFHQEGQIRVQPSFSDEELEIDTPQSQIAIWIKPDNFLKFEAPDRAMNQVLTRDTVAVGFTYEVRDDVEDGLWGRSMTEDEIHFPPYTILEVHEIIADGPIVVGYSVDEFDEPIYDRWQRFKIMPSHFECLKRCEAACLKLMNEKRDEAIALLEEERDQNEEEITKMIMKTLSPEVLDDPNFDENKPMVPYLEGFNIEDFFMKQSQFLEMSPMVMEEPTTEVFKVTVRKRPFPFELEYGGLYPTVSKIEAQYVSDAGVKEGMRLMAVGVKEIEESMGAKEVRLILSQTMTPVNFLFSFPEDDDSDFEEKAYGFKRGDKIRAIESFDGDSIDSQRILNGDVMRIVHVEDGLRVQRENNPWPRKEWIFEHHYKFVEKVGNDERIRQLVDDFVVNIEADGMKSNRLEEMLLKQKQERLMKWALGLALEPDKRGAILHFTEKRNPESYDKIKEMMKWQIDNLIDTFSVERLEQWSFEQDMVADIWRFPPPKQAGFDPKEINVIICGESGCGKTTLFRELCEGHENNLPKESEDSSSEEDDSEEEVSSHDLFHTDVIECTTLCRKVTIRKGNLKISLWDSPGWGTTKFRAEEHVRNLGLAHYSVVIICSQARIKEEEISLANELYKRKREFISVRTQLDVEIMRNNKGKKRKKKKKKAKKSKSAEAIIREDFLRQLKDHGIIDHEVYLIGMDGDANMVFDYEKMVNSLWSHVEMDLFRRAGSSAVKDGWCYHKGALSDVREDAFSLHPVPKKFELTIYDPREKLAKIETSNNTGWFILSRIYQFDGAVLPEADRQRSFTLDITDHMNDIIEHIGNPFSDFRSKRENSDHCSIVESYLMYTIFEFAMDQVFILNASDEGLKIVRAKVSIIRNHNKMIMMGTNTSASGTIAAFWSPKTVEVLTYFNEKACSVDTVLYYREGVCTQPEIEQIKKGRTSTRKRKRIPFFQGEFKIQYNNEEKSDEVEPRTQEALLSGSFTCVRKELDLIDRGLVKKYDIHFPQQTWTELFSQFLPNQKPQNATYGPNSITYPSGGLQDIPNPPKLSEELSISQLQSEMSYDAFLHHEEMTIEPDPSPHHFEELEPVAIFEFNSGQRKQKPLPLVARKTFLERAWNMLPATFTQKNLESISPLPTDAQRKRSLRASIFRTNPESKI